MPCRFTKVVALGVLALAATSRPALAQFPGGGGGSRPMGPGMGPGAPGAGAEKEEEQAAEAAPEQQGEQPALQPMPAFPGQQEKTIKFFQLDGYMRGRSQLYHNFNLGFFPANTTDPQAPFYVPYSESGATGQSAAPGNNASCAARDHQNCNTNNLTSADMRLRLEPTINVTDQVRVKAQIDIFDNLVAGSTPEGYYLNGLSATRDSQLAAFTRSQAAPEGGSNSFESSIHVKRAWAEVKTPIGMLKFGRMSPVQVDGRAPTAKPQGMWGTGMMLNGGDCLDCDYGTQVDRVMFTTTLWNHFFSFMWDWVATGPTTRLYTPNQQTGQAINADTLDDVSQWAIALGRSDTDEEIKARLENRETVFNYGAYITYRRQDWDNAANPGANPQTGGKGALQGLTPAQLSANLVPRGAWAFINSLWFRVYTGKLHLELEGALIGGKINSIIDQVPSVPNALTILQWGGVAKIDYKLLRDSALTLYFEFGYASGDDTEDPNAIVNYRLAQRTFQVGNIGPSQTRLSNFNFDPDYHVDLILFRRIIGTVTNATYFKPSISYDISLNTLLCSKGTGGCGLLLRLDGIYSLANRFVAYPGNSVNLGIELDGSLMYHNDGEGFYVGLAYGVLFPLGALNIPGTIYGIDHTAEAAQTLQARVIVKF